MIYISGVNSSNSNIGDAIVTDICEIDAMVVKE